MFLGRWLNLVFYSYVEGCRSVGVEPFYRREEAVNTEPAKSAHDAFVKAATNTRDRLVQETGTLVSDFGHCSPKAPGSVPSLRVHGTVAMCRCSDRTLQAYL